MKELLDNGLIHGDCLTITGETVAENLKSVPSLSELEQVCLLINNSPRLLITISILFVAIYTLLNDSFN